MYVVDDFLSSKQNFTMCHQSYQCEVVKRCRGQQKVINDKTQITHFCRIRDEGGAGCPHPTNNFRRTELAPASYISLEREFNGGEWDSF